MSRLVREDRAASSEVLYLCISSCRDVIIKEKYDLADQLISRLSGVVVHSLPSVEEIPSSNPGLTTGATHLLV